MNTSAKNVVYPGKSLLNCNITTGMDYEQVTAVLAAAIEIIHSGQDLSSLDLSQFGINCNAESNGPILAQIIKVMMDGQQELNNKLKQVVNFYTTVKSSFGAISDEKVKVTKESTTSKYLAEAIKGASGRIQVVDDTLVISGLVPIGTRAYISPARAKDFDNNGKGKATTDLKGWAIRNGQNGLDNALGRFVMTTDTIENAGKKAGNNQYKVSLSNIEGFTLNVTGDIKESLLDPITIKTKLNTKHKCFGVSSCLSVIVRDPNGPIEVDSNPINVKHSHTHALKAEHKNDAVQPLTIIPEHIKEIPIEYIG